MSNDECTMTNKRGEDDVREAKADTKRDPGQGHSPILSILTIDVSLPTLIDNAHPFTAILPEYEQPWYTHCETDSVLYTDQSTYLRLQWSQKSRFAILWQGSIRCT